MKKQSKKRNIKKPSSKKAASEIEPSEIEKGFDFGGLPDRNLKKNLGCWKVLMPDKVAEKKQGKKNQSSTAKCLFYIFLAELDPHFQATLSSQRMANLFHSLLTEAPAVGTRPLL